MIGKLLGHTQIQTKACPQSLPRYVIGKKICLFRVRCQRTALRQSGKNLRAVERLSVDDPGRALAGLPGRKDARADEPADDDGVDRKLFGGLGQDQFAEF